MGRSGDTGDIFSFSPDGKSYERIRCGSDVACSPDGNWIAFVAREDKTDNDGIWVMRPNGKSAMPIAYHNDATASAPTWAPNSNEIAYQYYNYEKQEYRICIVNPSNGQIRAITESGYTNPQWLSTNEILFEKEFDYEVFIANHNGIRKSEFLSNFIEEHFSYTFSHDASQIAGVKNTRTICIVNSDGSNYREFDFPNFHIAYVRWAPDDRCLIFSVQRSAEQWVQELWAISVDGTHKWLVFKSRQTGVFDDDLRLISSFSGSPPSEIY
jgi:hypothetical protein